MDTKTIEIPISARYMVLSALGFALMGACVKAASYDGIPVLEIVAVRALVSSCISYLDVRRKNISIWGHNKFLLVARGLTGTLALMCVFYAVTALPLAEATLIQYLNPLFTALLAFAFLKEVIQRSTVISIILSLIGLLVMVNPDILLGNFMISVGALPLAGVIAALLGALGSAVAYVFVRRLSETEDPSVIIFYFPIIALPVSVLLLGDDFVMPSSSTWIWLILVGIFTQVGQIGLTKAMQTEKAGKAMAYSYVQIVFSALLGWFLFDEIPTLVTLLGALFIISGALINLRHRK
ncbi:MAG: DMT family transporter [Proteobacteria bacterium]|nr:DMT family transporter [Pseudomonadota bacterium]